MRALAICLGALLAMAPLALADKGAAPVVLLDFETGEPADGWKRKSLGLQEASVEGKPTPSGGRVLGLRGTDKGGHIYRPISVSDWRPFRALSFFAKVDAAKPIQMRVLAVEADNFRSRLKRFELQPGDWREVVLPLSSFRWDFKRPAARIDHIGRILFQWDKGEGTVFLDDVRLLPGERGNASWLPTEEERLALVFPDGDGHLLRSESFVLLTDVDAVDEKLAGPLFERLEKGLALLRDRYAVPGELPERVPICLLAEKEDFQELYPRVGRHYGADCSAPTSDGFSALGYSGTTWDPKQGVERPVLVHEAMHGALERLILVGSDGNWIQEALANGVQLSIHPEALGLDLGKAFRDRQSGKGNFISLSQLVSTKRPGMKHYAQLATIFEFLAEEHPKALPGFWTQVLQSWKKPHESGPAALEGVLEKPLEQIGVEWLAWGTEHYGD